ncbi:CD44 antigen isoform X12 [Zootoca vivipara]|uniref:CD44 antigen isoform X12 n=1 Tax=Zootoca vivipara TaxID=8524 RepID=UPI00293BF44D|nr:CD44 antigen isoform X12 [Zootoca vivipara]
MAKVWLGAAVGFYLLQLSLARIDLNISCRYAGVFHVEKNRRYSLSREEAVELCKALNSTLPTWDQMQKAYDQGFETCRYGYIEEKIVVPRHTPYTLCAANHTGIYVLSSNISDKYDTYCFNSSESRDIVCDPVVKLYSIWPDEDSKIEIYNADGSHYIEGERFTKQPPISEDDNIGGSGSANDRSTTDPNVISPGISSRYPHHADGGTFPSKEPFAEKDEDATDVPNTYDGHQEGGHSKDQHPQSPTVVSTKDVKHDDAAHDSFLHGVHSEKDSEVKYSTNGTREDVLPLGDDEHYSTATAGSSSDDFFKQEDSTQNPLDGALSGLETEDTLPTTTASDVLHPALVPSSERERTMEEGSSHHTVLAFNESAGHEESHQDQLSTVGKPGRRSGSATNRTIIGVLETLIPQSEKDRDNEHSQTADDGMKVEESTQGPPSHGIYPEWSNGERYPTNSSSKETLPEIIHPSENEQKNESIYTAVVSSDSTDYEDAGRDTMLHSEHSGQDNEEKHLTNTSGNHLLPGILHAAESEHENERSDTAVASSDNGKQEDTTQKPQWHAMHPGWESEDEDTTNTTMDNIPPIIILSSEGKHEKETHHTAVVSNGGSDHEDSTQEAHPSQNNEHRNSSSRSTDYFVPGIISSVDYVHENETPHIAVIHNDHEDSTQQPLPPIHQPGWDAEEIYPTNTSRDGIPMGVDSDSESKQTDVAKEDSTPEPVRQWGHEDKYTTKSTADVLVPGIVPRRGISQKNNTDHTAVVSKDGAETEESTQDPQLHGLRPEWSTEDEPVVNGTQDYVLPGVFPEIDSGSDRHPSSPTASVNPNDPKKGSGRGTHIDQTGESPKSQPRMSDIPDWLIVVASLLALALILGVCIAVNSRRRCGQKQKLIINNGKGGMNETNKGGLNGEASRSREMVHLVHDEKPENQTDEFQAIDETQNQQEVALKSGV